MIGLAEANCALLQPEKTTVAENAAIPLSSCRRESSMEGVELSIEPIGAMVSLYPSRSANKSHLKTIWYSLIPLSCNHLARYRNGQIGDNVRRFCSRYEGIGGAHRARVRPGVPGGDSEHDQGVIRCMERESDTDQKDGCVEIADSSVDSGHRKRFPNGLSI